MTARQLTLDASTIDERWRQFVNENPHVLPELARITRALLTAGVRPTVARVWEEARDRLYTTGDHWRLNNTLRAPAARAIMRDHPDLAGVFTTRRSQADR